MWLTNVFSNILFLPFRRTHTVSLSAAIRQYISSKYDQHPDMFVTDLAAIDKLRADAVNAFEPHVSGTRKLTAYAAQLVWIGESFLLTSASTSHGTLHLGIIPRHQYPRITSASNLPTSSSTLLLSTPNSPYPKSKYKRRT